MSFAFSAFGRPIALATALAFAAVSGAAAAPLPVPAAGLSGPDSQVIEVASKKKRKPARKARRGAAIGAGVALGILGAAAAAAANSGNRYYYEDDDYYYPPPRPAPGYYYGSPYGYQQPYGYQRPWVAQPRRHWNNDYGQNRRVYNQPARPAPVGPPGRMWRPGPGQAPVCNGCDVAPLYQTPSPPGRGP